MRIFNDEQFNKLITSSKTEFKLPEQGNEIYFLIEILTNENITGIGNDDAIYLQRWELFDLVTIDDCEYFLFTICGRIPNQVIESKDISQHIGKEMAVPINTIYANLDELCQQSPNVFNDDNFKKTQVLRESLPKR